MQEVLAQITWYQSEVAQAYRNATEEQRSQIEARIAVLLKSSMKSKFEAIAPELIQFPSLDGDILRSRVESFIEHFESKSESGQQ